MFSQIWLNFSQNENSGFNPCLLHHLGLSIVRILLIPVPVSILRTPVNQGTRYISLAWLQPRSITSLREVCRHLLWYPKGGIQFQLFTYEGQSDFSPPHMRANQIRWNVSVSRVQSIQNNTTSLATIGPSYIRIRTWISPVPLEHYHNKGGRLHVSADTHASADLVELLEHSHPPGGASKHQCARGQWRATRMMITAKSRQSCEMNIF